LIAFTVKLQEPGGRLVITAEVALPGTDVALETAQLVLDTVLTT